MKVRARHLRQQLQLQKMARPEVEAQLEVSLSSFGLISVNIDTNSILQ